MPPELAVVRSRGVDHSLAHTVSEIGSPLAGMQRVVEAFDWPFIVRSLISDHKLSHCRIRALTHPGYLDGDH
jgi:hypothetical protein